MKILPVVFAFILLLSALTFARYDNFAQQRVVRSLQQPLHRGGEGEKTESFAVFNAAQYQLYKSFHREEDEGGEQEEEGNALAHEIHDETREVVEEKSPDKLCSYLDLGYFKGEQASPDQTAWVQRVDLLKKLLTALYGEAPFFTRVKREVPDLEDRIVAEMVHSLYTWKKGANNKKVLEQLSFADPDIHDVYGCMLSGSTQEGVAYSRLLDHVTIQAKASLPVSVYLAPSGTLLALFGTPETVQEILTERKKIYHKLSKDKEEQANKQQYASDFRQQFAGRLHSDISPDLIAWGVSTTQPRK